MNVRNWNYNGLGNQQSEKAGRETSQFMKFHLRVREISRIAVRTLS
jgi:hypothetical protein